MKTSILVDGEESSVQSFVRNRLIDDRILLTTGVTEMTLQVSTGNGSSSASSASATLSSDIKSASLIGRFTKLQSPTVPFGFASFQFFLLESGADFWEAALDVTPMLVCLPSALLSCGLGLQICLSFCWALSAADSWTRGPRTLASGSWADSVDGWTCSNCRARNSAFILLLCLLDGLPPDEEASASFLPNTNNPVGRVVVAVGNTEICFPATTLLVAGLNIGLAKDGKRNHPQWSRQKSMGSENSCPGLRPILILYGGSFNRLCSEIRWHGVVLSSFTYFTQGFRGGLRCVRIQDYEEEPRFLPWVRVMKLVGIFGSTPASSPCGGCIGVCKAFPPANRGSHGFGEKCWRKKMKLKERKKKKKGKENGKEWWEI
ncbi:hypothetical protein M5K25_012645 [Dendrobium thyrsiflorum]|uniref:Uncharacterized protein n=1 Tax=Dendrobium thyrsiflorum TaxID=117978 RepID=A0ABD0V4N5_DENTH